MPVYITLLLIGISLSMDAFSLSIASGFAFLIKPSPSIKTGNLLLNSDKPNKLINAKYYIPKTALHGNLTVFFNQ